MILHKNEELFSQLIEATARDMNINPLYVEKDYWVTYILKQLSLSDYVDTVIFKGGTSLSKAHKIIHRFSEDIDLAIITNDLNGNQIKTLIKNIEKTIIDTNFQEIELSDTTSKGSQFRKTVHRYPKINNGDFGHANENIILEINSFTKPTPYSKKSINTYIGEFLENKEPDAIKEFELKIFEINVLDMRRTFCEKISAVARASHESDKEQTELKNKIRHLYDIHLLLPHLEDFISSNDFIKLIGEVREDDKNQFSNAEWTAVEFHATPIFKDSFITMESLNQYYTSIFKDLVYSDIYPNMEDLKKSINEIADTLKQANL